jgi:hypothetical protein
MTQRGDRYGCGGMGGVIALALGGNSKGQMMRHLFRHQCVPDTDSRTSKKQELGQRHFSDSFIYQGSR